MGMHGLPVQVEGMLLSLQQPFAAPGVTGAAWPSAEQLCLTDSPSPLQACCWDWSWTQHPMEHFRRPAYKFMHPEAPAHCPLPEGGRAVEGAEPLNCLAPLETRPHCGWKALPSLGAAPTSRCMGSWPTSLLGSGCLASPLKQPPLESLSLCGPSEESRLRRGCMTATVAPLTPSCPLLFSGHKETFMEDVKFPRLSLLAKERIMEVCEAKPAV